VGVWGVVGHGEQLKGIVEHGGALESLGQCGA
jgi:hypothetical protein